MQHWDRDRYRKRVSRQVGVLILLVASVAFVADKSRSKDMGKAPRLKNIASMRIDGRELSGIRIAGNDQSGLAHVSTIGDSVAVLNAVTVSEDGRVQAAEKIDFGAAVEARFSLCHGATGADCKEALKLVKSQWEALQVDGRGQHFLLQEYSRTIVVLDGTLSKVVHVLEFDFSGSKFALSKRSKRYMKLDDSHSAEGFLLMNNGHILIAKEKSPTVLAEFGPMGSTASGIDGSLLLKEGEFFEFAGSGDRTKLELLAEWQIAGNGKCDISDLAADGEGFIYVLSENCGSIQKIERLTKDDPIVVAIQKWRLPKAIKNPEGLAVDGLGRFWITSDIKDESDNLFIVLPDLLVE